MVDITRLRIDNITTDGYYFDDGNAFFKISDEDILRLREYYNDPTIAYRREIVVRKDVSKNNEQRRKYSLEHKNKYNNGRNRIKGKINKTGKLVIVGGVLVSMIAASNIIGSALKVNEDLNEAIVTEVEMDNNEVIERNNFDTDNMIQAYVNTENVEKEVASYNTDVILDKVVVSFDNNSSVENNYVPTSVDTVEIKDDINVKRQEIIKKYCDIYSVDYNVVYDKIVELTSNFTSEEYLNDFTISGVKCKKAQVYANNEEHLLLLTIRHIKQIPSDFNLTEQEVIKVREGLEETRKYDEAGNVVLDMNTYLDNVSYYANLFNLDRCLLRAIIQSECGFDSSQFNGQHNPAGLRDEKAQFRTFDGDVEGLIEFCTEMVKYYDLGAETFSDIRDIHAPLSDGNEYWLDNVTECYFDTVANEAAYFGNVEEKNTLGR